MKRQKYMSSGNVLPHYTVASNWDRIIKKTRKCQVKKKKDIFRGMTSTMCLLQVHVEPKSSAIV